MLAQCAVFSSSISPSPGFVTPGLALGKTYGTSILAFSHRPFENTGWGDEVDTACGVDHFSMAEGQPKL